MSNDLYKTMLSFDKHRGLAKADGVSIELTVAPPIAGLPQHTTEIHFYPMVRDYRLRESANAMREMYPPEVEAVKGFLANLAALGKQLLRL